MSKNIKSDISNLKNPVSKSIDASIDRSVEMINYYL